MVPTYIFAVLIFVSCVLCENCVIYDFEDDLANNFTSHEVCNQQPWERKLYPSGEVNSPHIKSTAFITPSTVLSCMTSSLFAMHKDGVFEFNVYTSLTLDTDFVKVIVYQKEMDGPDTIVGISETNLVAGSYKNSAWTTLKVKLLGSESFNGYFTIFGRASMDSLIVMDALKYESPFLANEICEIYADDDADPDSGSTENYPGSSDSNESTVGTVSTESYPGSSDSNESTVGTVSTESYPGTSDSNESTVGTGSTESYPGTSDSNETDPDSESNENPGAGCVTYQFGQDFNSLFSNDGVCRYSANWLLRNYTSLTIDSPHKNSVSCIIPGNGWSCTSSFTFPMSAGGILEVEVYLEPFSATDRVLVTVYQINSLGTDLVVGSAASDRQFGWSTLRIQLAGDGDYHGQVTIMGQVAIRSLAIVDSFRYIPPTVDESLCIVYDETPVISPTTEANEASTTPEVEEPDSEEDGCVTYQFGQDYNTLFSSDGVCRYSTNWLLRNYSMLAIDSPHEDSFSCIIPGNGWSCTSSFIFPMSAGGILEMKVYLQPFLAADRVLVTVYQINSLGTDLVVGSAGTDRQFGWSTLRIQLAGDGDFDGQITIMGQVAIRSVVLVDSFRYIPPSSNEENCKIYN
ncbi:uncharacterized protein LOC114353333 isoform X3 [Ostrinia furnacalis]|uniref:uncharacterized protein LOC114353333 isoform X3 n=1 Tax=Ostrinia furnacalis TaxID=93504 RepID=UPI00103CBCC8|nr:uncharacterized protein LOC114353333 isoform X3 [Ostrinia furnacalis]